MSLRLQVSVNFKPLRRVAARFLAVESLAFRDLLIRKMLFDAIAEIVSTVPVDTGRYRAGFRGEVQVNHQQGLSSAEVVNPVEYGPLIEYGTATRPPGNHVAIALENTRRRTLAEAREVGIALAASWQDAL